MPSLSVADVSVKVVAELEIAEASVVSKNAIVVGIASDAPSFTSVAIGIDAGTGAQATGHAS